MEEMPESSGRPASRRESAGKPADILAQELDHKTIGEVLDEAIADEALTVSPNLKKRMTRLFHEYFSSDQANAEKVIAEIREFSGNE